MKKLIFLSFALLTSANISSAADGGRSETKESNFDVVIKNQTGEELFIDDFLARYHTLGGIGRLSKFPANAEKHFSNVVTNNRAYVMGEPVHKDFAQSWQDAFKKHKMNGVYVLKDYYGDEGNAIYFKPKFMGRETFALRKNDAGAFYIEKISEEDLEKQDGDRPELETSSEEETQQQGACTIM